MRVVEDDESASDLLWQEQAWLIQRLYLGDGWVQLRVDGNPDRWIKAKEARKIAVSMRHYAGEQNVHVALGTRSRPTPGPIESGSTVALLAEDQDGLFFGDFPPPSLWFLLDDPHAACGLWLLTEPTGAEVLQAATAGLARRGDRLTPVWPGQLIRLPQDRLRLGAQVQGDLNGTS